MKNIFILFILGMMGILNANINIVVSVLPQQVFVKAIGGDKVNITLMVKPGSSPHTYDPKPSQMKNISKADIYFSIDIEFEKAWLPRFQNQNQKMKIVNISNNIEKQAIVKYHHENEHHHKNEVKDPHIWTSPKNVKIIVKNIYDTLIKIDNKNQTYYKKNYDNFISLINQTDKTIKDILKNVPKGTTNLRITMESSYSKPDSFRPPTVFTHTHELFLLIFFLLFV